MTDKNDGGPAYPGMAAKKEEMVAPDIMKSTETGAHQGMSLRDYFAGQVLAGLSGNLPSDFIMRDIDPRKDTAKKSYQLADAMLAERDKEQTS